MFKVRHLFWKVIAVILFLCLVASTWYLISVTKAYVRINRSIAASEATIAKLRLQRSELIATQKQSSLSARSLGTFTVTAYCACKICCGTYGINRPVVKGKSVVVTASGELANEGITIAADPKVLPIGSHVIIQGVGLRIVQDVGGGIKGKRIDIYFNSHSRALSFGKPKLEVRVLDFEPCW